MDGKWIPRSDLKCPPIDTPLMQQEVVGESIKLFKDNGEVDTLTWSIEYTKRLEEKGRFQLCIWPEHCLIGTPGHNVVKNVRDAIEEWSDKTGRSVEWVEKGQNLLTEMYSALCAEVPVNEKTSFNTDLLDSVSSTSNNVFEYHYSYCLWWVAYNIILFGQYITAETIDRASSVWPSNESLCELHSTGYRSELAKRADE